LASPYSILHSLPRDPASKKTQTKHNPNKTQTKPKQNPNKTQTKPKQNPNKTQTKPKQNQNKTKPKQKQNKNKTKPNAIIHMQQSDLQKERFLSFSSTQLDNSLMRTTRCGSLEATLVACPLDSSDHVWEYQDVRSVVWDGRVRRAIAAAKVVF
jgi:flagellar biosynthesis GTPase FlhF